MGKVRICDGRCHNAKEEACSCWCGGVFHGAGGQNSRDAFVKEWQRPFPKTEEEFQTVTGQGELFRSPGGEAWRRAITAAREARN